MSSPVLPESGKEAQPTINGVPMIKATDFYWAGERGLLFDNGDGHAEPDLIFYFIDKKVARNIDAYKILKERFPQSVLFGCSTSGPVLRDDIYLDTFTGLAITFQKTKIKTVQIECRNQDQSFEAGKEIVKRLAGDKLRHIFVITDGMSVRGTNFISGANQSLPDGVSITGGMASDGFEFQETLVGINTPLASGQVCAIGFYGDSLECGYSAQGGWSQFGLERMVTKSDGNMLYELDGKPALDLYKDYLGPDAKKLPGSGLLFPLAIRQDKQHEYIVRTIDHVDEEAKALRFTGDIPQGYIAQFMKGNFSHLAEGAGNAAEQARRKVSGEGGFALIVSCLGRQLLMGNQISDELEAVTKMLPGISIAGFYSNGEFSYSNNAGQACVLHNQTMTLTIFQET